MTFCSFIRIYYLFFGKLCFSRLSIIFKWLKKIQYLRRTIRNELRMLQVKNEMKLLIIACVIAIVNINVLNNNNK